MPKTIYLITSKEAITYDEYDSAIVIASSPKKARKIATKLGGNALEWVDVKIASCKEIGFPKNGQQEGIILSSFNAG